MKPDMIPTPHQSEADPMGSGEAVAATGQLLPQDAATAPSEQTAMGGGAYEGAERLSRELASWTTGSRSADGDLLPVKDIVDARVKDIARNDSYVDNAIEKYKDSVVGAKFALNANPNIDYLKRQDKRFDDTWLEEFQEEVEALWELCAESNSRYLDAQRKKTFTEMIRLGVGSYMLHGENFISSEWMRRTRRPFKTAFLMLDPSRIDDPHLDMNGERPKNVRRGVRLNAVGEPVGYFIQNEHPHDYYPMFKSPEGIQFQYTPRETPWGRPNIHHGFEEKRVSQTRGVSKMVSALKEMKMTKVFRDVALQNWITNATYAAAIESELPTDQIFEMMGGTDISAKQFKEGVAGYTGGYLGALAAYLKDSNGTLLNGVRIPHLFPGTKLNLMPAGSGGALGSDFEKSLLRYLAADMNMSYEQFSGDMSGVNYSTLKGAINETEKHMKVVKRVEAERAANFIYGNWLEEMIVSGMVTSMPKNAPDFWDGLNREAYTQAQWFNSGRGQIEELKETQASALRLKSKVSTFEDEMGRLGKDWRQVLTQQAREKRYAEKLGIDLSFEDNSLNAASGAPREKEASEDKGEGPVNED